MGDAWLRLYVGGRLALSANKSVRAFIDCMMKGGEVIEAIRIGFKSEMEVRAGRGGGKEPQPKRQRKAAQSSSQNTSQNTDDDKPRDKLLTLAEVVTSMGV